MIRIDDPDDPRLAAYRNVRERDLVRRQGRFVAEGGVVLRALLAARRFEIESVLLLENRVGGLGGLLPLVHAATPVYVVNRAVIDALTGFPMHRGVLAIGRRGQQGDADALLAALPERALVVAATGLANHDNVGAIFRNAAAFGAGAVLLDETSCDPLYRKAIRVSVGAALTVPFARGGAAADLLDLLARRRFDVLALSPRGSQDIAEVIPAARQAILLGSEGEGLPEALLRALRTVRIGMRPGFDSLNVAAASAIALHRLAGV